MDRKLRKTYRSLAAQFSPRWRLGRKHGNRCQTTGASESSRNRSSQDLRPGGLIGSAQTRKRDVFDAVCR